MIEKVSKKQAEILRFMNRPERYLICDGAVRSGKTVIMTMAFVIWAMDRFSGCNFAICSKTVANAERNVLAPLLTAGELPYRFRYHRQEKMLVCSMGARENRFYLFGGKDESSYMLIQGITLAGVMLDEVALMPRSFVEQALARTLTFEDAKIWFNCNPESQLHWFNTEWVEAADAGRKNAVHLHFMMRDNPIMSEKAIAETEQMFSGVFYRRYILGEWVMAEGLVYSMFDPDAHVAADVPTCGDWYVSSDFGVQNANVFLLWRKAADRDAWVCVRECYYSGRDEKIDRTTDQLAEMLRGMLGEIEPRQVIIDPSASAMIAELRRRGFHVIKAKNDVTDGIAEVSAMIRQGRLVFDPACKKTIEEFGLYAWDEKAARRGEDKPLKVHDHAMDAVRYFVKTKGLVKKKEEYTGIF